jgi:hypothetical protein
MFGWHGDQAEDRARRRWQWWPRRLCAHARGGPGVAFIAELKAVGGLLACQGCGGHGMGCDKAVGVATMCGGADAQWREARGRSACERATRGTGLGWRTSPYPTNKILGAGLRPAVSLGGRLYDGCPGARRRGVGASRRVSIRFSTLWPSISPKP